MIKIISFSRDGKGRVVKRNLRDIANTMHGSSSSGSNMSQYLLEKTDTMEEKTNKPSDYFIKTTLVREQTSDMGSAEYAVETNITTVRDFATFIENNVSGNNFGYIKVEGYGERPYNHNGEDSLDLGQTGGFTIVEVRMYQCFNKTDYVIVTKERLEWLKSMSAHTESQPQYRIRKLTPKECLRLMDVDDSNIEKMRSATLPNGKPVSNSQLYKMAGNSIVVSCLFHIFRNMFITQTDKAPEPVQLSLFDL